MIMATPPFRIGKRPLYEFSNQMENVPVANFPQYFEISQLGEHERLFVKQRKIYRKSTSDRLIWKSAL